MKTILIAEPHGPVRELLAHVITHLGHKPVDARELTPDELAAADVVILEPADSWSLRIVGELRSLRPELPVICMSIYPATKAAAALDPIAFLKKPFALADLEAALLRAVEAAG